MHFEIHYNADRIIEINVSTDPNQTVDISPDVASKTEGQQVPAEFTYRCCFLPSRQAQLPLTLTSEAHGRSPFQGVCLSCQLSTASVGSVRKNANGTGSSGTR